MKYPIKIALSQRVVSYNAYGEIRDCLSQEWFDFLEKFFLLGIPIPNKVKDVDVYLDSININGIILTGGNNISPQLYGSSSIIGDVSESRDIMEMKLIEYAIKRDIPVLGVCRGMQMINVYFNGKLSKVDHEELNHVATEHYIFLKDRNYNYELPEKTKTNSFHNYKVTRSELGRNLKPLFTAEDGTVEALYNKDHNILGIAWHPERRKSCVEIDEKLIKNLFRLGR